jgi:uncharacterized spore protein YtfJ
MSLERMFKVVEDLGGTASADAAFGEPVEAEGKVLISVAETTKGFGMAFQEQIAEGEQAAPSVDEQGPMGVGGAGRARPVAMVEVTAEGTVIRPVVDETKVFLAGIALMGWILLWVVAAVRSVFVGRHRPT